MKGGSRAAQSEQCLHNERERSHWSTALTSNPLPRQRLNSKHGMWMKKNQRQHNQRLGSQKVLREHAEANY